MHRPTTVQTVDWWYSQIGAVYLNLDPGPRVVYIARPVLYTHNTRQGVI